MQLQDPQVRMDLLCDGHTAWTHRGVLEAVSQRKRFSLLSQWRVYSSVCASSRKEAARAGPALPTVDILAGAQLFGLTLNKQALGGFRFAAWWNSHFSTLLFFPLSGAGGSAPRGFAGFCASYLSDLGFVVLLHPP